MRIILGNRLSPHPALKQPSTLVATLLVAFSIGAFYNVRSDVAKPSRSAQLVKTADVAAASSTTLDVNADGADIATFHPTVTTVPNPILVLRDVQYLPGSSSTTVTVDVDENVPYDINRLTNPDRIYLDLWGSQLGGALSRKRFQVTDPILRAIRVAEHKGNVTRVTLETKRACDYLLTTVRNSHQLKIEITESKWPELKP